MQIHFHDEIARKMLHISSVWIVVFLYFYPAILNIVLFGSLFVIGAITEYGYHKKVAFFYPLYKALFERILRTKERAGKSFRLSGGVYMFLSAFLVAILFSSDNASIAFSIMLVSDSFASLIGRKYGKIKIYKHKTLAGSLTFIASAFAIVLLFGIIIGYSLGGYVIGMLACIGATISELYNDKTKLDDNLVIPLVAGAILSLNTLL